MVYNNIKRLNNRSTDKGESMNQNYRIPLCECDEVHEDVVEKRKEQMPSYEDIYSLADFFKIFGDSTRMQILFVVDKGPVCVCDIAKALDMTKSAVSHQLKILRQAELITYRKSGKNVFYSLKDDHVRSIIQTAFEHIKE